MSPAIVMAIDPAGSVLRRADGSTVAVGGTVTDAEALVLTIPHAAAGGAVRILGGPHVLAIVEGRAAPLELGGGS